MIPAGIPRIVPGEFLHFFGLLPLPEAGVRENWYNRALCGAGFHIAF